MGFPLKMAGEPKEQVAAAVQEAVNVLQLEPLLDRLPKELAAVNVNEWPLGLIVRALWLLFDEPLSTWTQPSGTDARNCMSAPTLRHDDLCHP